MGSIAEHEERTQRWLARLTKLNPATGSGQCRGKAPHKPLLLLCLLDMAESGELLARAFTRSPGLVLRFRSYGALIVNRWPSRLDCRLPFYHLSTQRFWMPFTADMRQAKSPETCALCEMDPELYELLSDASFRLKARMLLIATYFEPVERIALCESLGLQSEGGSGRNANRVKEDDEQMARRRGRDARFSVRVCSAYRYTCALTAYRCEADGSSIVDAAHIEAWAATQNDDPTNGLALSKNAHWQFDAGLWSTDDQLRVIVNQSAFTEQGPDAFRLTSFVGRHLQFDPGSDLRPGIAFLRRHRQRHGILARRP